MTKKVLILVCGLIENLVFSGTVFGWPALFYMLKSEGIYEHLCESVETVNEIRTTNSTLFGDLIDNSINEIESNSSIFPKAPDISDIRVNSTLFRDVQVNFDSLFINISIYK